MQKKKRTHLLGITSLMVCVLASCANTRTFCPDIKGFDCLFTSEIDEVRISALFFERQYIVLEKKNDIRKFLRDALDFYNWDDSTFPYKATTFGGDYPASFDYEHDPLIGLHEMGYYGRRITISVDDDGVVYLVGIGRESLTMYSEKGLGNKDIIYKSYEEYPWF